MQSPASSLADCEQIWDAVLQWSDAPGSPTTQACLTTMPSVGTRYVSREMESYRGWPVVLADATQCSAHIQGTYMHVTYFRTVQLLSAAIATPCQVGGKLPIDCHGGDARGIGNELKGLTAAAGNKVAGALGAIGAATNSLVHARPCTTSCATAGLASLRPGTCRGAGALPGAAGSALLLCPYMRWRAFVPLVAGPAPSARRAASARRLSVWGECCWVHYASQCIVWPGDGLRHAQASDLAGGKRKAGEAASGVDGAADDVAGATRSAGGAIADAVPVDVGRLAPPSPRVLNRGRCPKAGTPGG